MSYTIGGVLRPRRPWWIRINGETRAIGPGDVVVIVPGERHRMWQEGEGDLALLVTCGPAYSVEKVVFTE